MTTSVKRGEHHQAHVREGGLGFDDLHQGDVILIAYLRVDAAKFIFFHQEYGERISIVCDSDRSAASFGARCVARPESALTWSRQSHKGAHQASTTLCRDWPAESLETPVPTTSGR